MLNSRNHRVNSRLQ